MNTKAIRQLADVTLDKYRSSIPRKAFEEFVKDIITGENRATAFRYEASPICRASFPSTLDEDGARCTVEVTVYRLNAVAVTAFLLDGPETLLRHIGLDERDTYTTKHEIDDLVTVVHITREEAPAYSRTWSRRWQTSRSCSTSSASSSAAARPRPRSTSWSA